MTRNVVVAAKIALSILFPGAKGSFSKQGNIVFGKGFLWDGNYECSLGWHCDRPTSRFFM